MKNSLKNICDPKKKTLIQTGLKSLNIEFLA